MNQQRWQQIDTILDEILDADPPQRQAVVQRLCSEDKSLPAKSYRCLPLMKIVVLSFLVRLQSIQPGAHSKTQLSNIRSNRTSDIIKLSVKSDEAEWASCI